MHKTRRWNVWNGLSVYGAIALLGVLTLSSCQTSSTGIRSGEFCLIAEPITYSQSQDSLATVEQIRAHNRVGRELCDW